MASARITHVEQYAKINNNIFIELINMYIYLIYILASVVASAGETDRDLAVTQFPRNCVPYNIIEFQTL
jgi:hypothetical protein